MAEMLTSSDLEDLLQVDRSTIYRMADSGRLPAVKVGRQWRFPRGAVERWLSGQVQEAGQGEAIAREPEASRGAYGWPTECVQLMLDAFADLLGVMLVFTDMTGEPITTVSNPQPFYEVLLDTTAGKNLCHETWHELGQIPAIEPRWISTFADLSCARALVRVGDKLEAMVIAFGIAPPGWSLSEHDAAHIARDLGLQGEEVRGVFSGLEPNDPEAQDEILKSLQRISDILAHIGSERSSLLGRLNEIARLSAL